MWPPGHIIYTEKHVLLYVFICVLVYMFTYMKEEFIHLNKGKGVYRGGLEGEKIMES